MDEQELAELFRDAVRDVPPATFDETDVRSASARATARRRASVVVGTAVAAALALGGTVAGLGVLDEVSQEDATVAGAATDPTPGVMRAPDEPGRADRGQLPGSAPTGGLPPEELPVEPPLQGGETTGSAGPPTGTTPPGCGEVDRELAVALAGELPAAATGGQPVPVAGECPAGSRAAGYLVRDGDAVGLFSVVVVPAGPEGASVGRAEVDQSPGARSASRPTLGGGLVQVLSDPAEGSAMAPFGDEVNGVADGLAGLF
ncbi:hypothetical protein [Umezawaea beigongshangensis]|uniref:hypothetical protein n=1 Tax=Umezawaea beigongshangensis TaxID=2780383 RepID=UPI0018F2346C|nr:hypothetical protein [Umezawaea beigongshangensis]